MDRRSALIRLASSSALCLWRPVRAQDAVPVTGLAGEWGGLLDLGPRGLRLKLLLALDGAEWNATCYSLDQQNAEIPASKVVVDGARLRVEFAVINAALDTHLVSPDLLVGTWKQGGEFAITLARNPDYEALLPEVEPLSATVLEALRAKAGTPALAAGVRRDGEARLWATGRRVAKREEPVTTTDLWHLGSITKSMTATLVGRVVEAGKASWDLTVGAVLGEVVGELQTAYADVTFLHLLSHRSGLPANLPRLAFMMFEREAADARASRLEFVKRALQQEPAGPAEETFLYSNNGFIVAGAMLEQLLGVSWERAVRDYVFAPLDLTSAGFGPPGRSVTTVLAKADFPEHPAQPAGHQKNLLSGLGLGGPMPMHPDLAHSDNPVALGPAGRVHMTLGDLLTYLSVHRDRTDFLEPETWDRLHTPPFGGDYALGWIVRDDGTVWHNGSNTLWYAEASFHRESGVAAAAATNSAIPEAMTATARALAAAAIS